MFELRRQRGVCTHRRRSHEFSVTVEYSGGVDLSLFRMAANGIHMTCTNVANELVEFFVFTKEMLTAENFGGNTPHPSHISN